MLSLKPQLDTKRTVGTGSNGRTIKKSVAQEIRVSLGEVVLSKNEYKAIRKIMIKWNVDIGALCRYSLKSIIEAHIKD